MPGRTEVLQIGTRVFQVTQLPAMRAVKLAARLGRLVGPAVGAAMDKGLNANISVEAVARVLFDKLDPDELEKLLRDLLATTTRGDGSGHVVPVMEVFDVEFAGDGLRDLMKLVQFALTTQFGSFGAALQAVGNAVLPQTARPQVAPMPEGT